VLVAVAGAALAVLCRKAFGAYFFSETFTYLTSYRAAGESFWRMLASPHGGVFFRPVLWAVNLPWNLWLPPDPLLYHLRNAALVLVNLALLHRILLRTVPVRGARVVAVLFVAFSKVHLTTIGYVAAFSTLVMLSLTLVAMLFLLRGAQSGRTVDGLVGLGAAGLCVFTKDYGAAVVPVLAALWLAYGRAMPARRFFLRWLAPLSVVVAASLVLRAVVVGAPPSSGPYAPRLDAIVSVRKLAAAAGTLGNFSLLEPAHVTGGRGVARWVTGEEGADAGQVVELVLTLLFLGILLATVLALRLLVPLVWGAAFFLPTFLTRNEQMYYLNDLVAAVGLLLGIALGELPRRWTRAWCVLLVVVALNAGASQQRMAYVWYDYASELAPLRGVVHRFGGRKVGRVVAVTTRVGHWQFALDAGGRGTMLGELLRSPDLTVEVVTPADWRGEAAPPPGTLVLDADDGLRVLASTVPGAQAR
jgi:hypothetical protein